MQIIGRGATREEAFDNWKQAAKADVKERSEKIMALLLKVRSLDRKFVRTRIENTEYVCEGLFSGEYRNLANEITRLTVVRSSGLSAGMLDELFDLIADHVLKERQRAAASKLNTENRAIKQDVFLWLDANPPKPRGKSAAATAIAGKVAPVVFTTALKWVNEWEKLRSTGTP